MFVGHYSAALVAKRVAPEIPLPVYFLVCQTIDIFWATFVLLGIEKVRFVDHINATNSLDLYFMPFTHSLPGALGWAFGIASLYWLFAKSNPNRVRNTVLFGVVVLSHWVLDLLVHMPDLPLWYDSYKVGFGLWNFQIFECVLELTLIGASVAIALPVAGENRQRFIMLGIAMAVFQLICVLTPTPALDYQIASHLMASYASLTVFSYFADKKNNPVHAR
jgi:hypothetical protein